MFICLVIFQLQLTKKHRTRDIERANYRKMADLSFVSNMIPIILLLTTYRDNFDISTHL